MPDSKWLAPSFAFAAAIVKRIDGRKHPKVLRWPVKPQEQVHLSEDGTYGAGVRFWCFVCPVRRFRIPFQPHAFLENPSRPRAPGRFLLSAGWAKNSKKQKSWLTVSLRVELYL